MGFPILIFDDISDQDYYLVWSASQNAFRKVQKVDLEKSITNEGLTVNGKLVVDADGLVLATMSQPEPGQLLFDGKEFRIQANDEERKAVLKFYGRADGPDGVKIFNEWELAADYASNEFQITPDADNVGGSPKVIVGGSIQADSYLRTDGTPLVSSVIPFFALNGFDLLFGQAAQAYTYISSTATLMIQSGAPGAATWTFASGTLDIDTED